MKKTIGTLVAIAALGMVFASGVQFEKHTANEPRVTIDKQGDKKQVFETEKVKIEYWDITKNGDFDIIVTPKNGMNISPETQLDDGKWYKDGYLVGTTKERAEQHVETAKKMHGIKWDFKWNQ